ncbi:hypothetical protein Tco_1318561 [Tanacetum coccineum]
MWLRVPASKGRTLHYLGIHSLVSVPYKMKGIYSDDSTLVEDLPFESVIVHALVIASAGSIGSQSQFSRPIRRIHQGRYDVSVPELTKDHKGMKSNTPYPEEVNTPY